MTSLTEPDMPQIFTYAAKNRHGHLHAIPGDTNINAKQEMKTQMVSHSYAHNTSNMIRPETEGCPCGKT